MAAKGKGKGKGGKGIYFAGAEECTNAEAPDTPREQHFGDECLVRVAFVVLIFAREVATRNFWEGPTYFQLPGGVGGVYATW
jgi:hypothetical protein